MPGSSRVGGAWPVAWRRTIPPRNTERVAWVLIVFAAVFWLWFGIASAIGEHLGPANALLHVLVPGGTFAIIGVLARRWRTPAAIALIAIGTFVAIAYPLVYIEFFTASTVALVVATMAVPPLVAGILLLVARSRAQG
jgi:hypothetical protein